VVSGPYGSRGAAGAYNPRTGTSAATRQGSGTYGSWGSTGVANGNDWAKTSRVTNNITGATTRKTTTSEGGSLVTRTGGVGGANGFAGVSGSGDVYAGRDGNVYKKSGDSWQKYGGDGNWNSVQASPEQRQSAQQRSEGAQRTRDASSVRSGATSSRAGSYRPSAPARGGGGRRR